MNDRLRIARWAQWLLTQDNWVVLDTETTGLEGYAEIVELAVVDKAGTVLLDTLVRPQENIPLDAQAIHGITTAMTRDAPTFPAIWPSLLAILNKRPYLVIYNADFDFPKIWYHAKRYGLPLPTLSLQCLMKIYAHYFGGCTTPRECRCRWRKLEDACSHLGVPMPHAHRASADAQATLLLLKALARQGG